MNIRSLFKILGGLLAFVLAATIAVPFLIPTDFVKAQLIAQVKSATGREFNVSGRASLRVFPNIAVTLDGITLGNPAGFSGPYLAKIGSLQLGVALQPLLQRQLEVTGITVENADIRLEETKSGLKNWEFAAEKKPQAPAAATSAQKSASPLTGFSLGTITVRHSAFSLNKASEKPLAAKDVDLTLEGADGHGTLSLDAAANYQGENVKFDLTVADAAAFFAGRPSALTIDAALPHSTLQANGSAALKEGEPAAELAKFAFKSAHLGQLIAWATGKPAGSGLPEELSLQTALSVKDSKHVALKDLALRMPGLEVNGALVLNLAGAVPALSGTLNLPQLDLGKLPGSKKPAAQAASRDASAAAATPGWSNAPIDLTALRALNANLALRIERLISDQLQIENIRAELALQGGVMNLKILESQLYHGGLTGTLSLDGSQAAAGLRTQLVLKNLEIESLMEALSGKSRLKGTTNLSLNLAGRGGSERAIVSSLSGDGALSVRDGAVKGVNIGQFLRNAQQGRLFSSHTASASTDFTELRATYTIAQGILTNRDLSMLSPALRLAGQGTVDLPQRALNYRLTPTLAATSEGQGGQSQVAGLAVPLLITGPWDNPQITPDVAGALRETLKDPKAAAQSLKNIKQGLKQFNSPQDLQRALLGGAPSQPAPAEPAAAPQSPPSPPPVQKPPSAKQQLLQQGLGALLAPKN